jgi:two-component system, response regulator PdtaR
MARGRRDSSWAINLSHYGTNSNLAALARWRIALAYLETKRPVVLVVEDEFLIRMDAVDMVRAAGFDVTEAESADEAILILESRVDIEVVFTDIQMPGSMDGLKLAAAIRGRWPPIKIVATSGLVNFRKEDLPLGSRFLNKPYSATQIVGTLRELTDTV